MKLPSLQTKEDLLTLGQYFTRSKLRPKKSRQSRKPRSASSNIDYEEKSPPSDSEKKPKNKRLKPKPSTCRPSESRIRSQSAPTVQPSVRLPPAEKPDSEEPDQEETPTNLETPKQSGADLDTKVKSKVGQFETQAFTLKKRKRQRTYGCKLCAETLSSAHLLTVHHREKHEILYYDICTKAFNNPTSLCAINTSTGNTDMCVHVEPPSHSQASYTCTRLCIDGMHHIIAFTQTASVHSKTKVT